MLICKLRKQSTSLVGLLNMQRKLKCQGSKEVGKESSICSVISCTRVVRVQFSCSVVSDSLRPHRLQHTRPPCPSPTPTVYSNSCPLSQWCHPTIPSSVFPFTSHHPSSPASGFFPMSQFSSGGQSIGVSASASVLLMNIQDWFQDGLVGSPCSPRDSQESSPTPQFKSINSSTLSVLYCPTIISVHDYCKNDKFD